MIFGPGAGSGNRTRIFSLEGCCTTIVLYPRPRRGRHSLKEPRGGGSRTRTCEGVRQRIYSPPPLPLGTFPQREFFNKDPLRAPSRGAKNGGRLIVASHRQRNDRSQPPRAWSPS